MKNQNDAKIADIINQMFCSEDSSMLDSIKEGIDECVQDFLSSKRIYNSLSLEALSSQFKGSEIPHIPMNFSCYLDFLKQNVIPNTVNVCNKAYIGHMTSMLPIYLGYINLLISIMNQNVVKIETSMVLTLIERQVLAMIHRLIYQLPDSFYESKIQDRKTNMGMIVSGGTIANISALWLARNKVFKENHEFDGIQKEGFSSALKYFGYDDAVIIGSSLMHYSVDKLASMIGLGQKNILKVKTNAEGKICINELENVMKHSLEKKKMIIAIIGIAGTTETGKVDDLEAMAEICEKYSVHFHVDAAWGGPLLFSQKHKHILKGIEKADSVIICGHKQLYLPQGTSMLICKDPEQINNIRFTTRYQARKESLDLGKHSPEGSRPANSLLLHAAFSLIGKQGYGYLIDEGIRKTRYFADLIKKHPSFELLEEPQTNIVVYRYITPDLREKAAHGKLTSEDNYILNCMNEVLQEELFFKGNSFISRTSLRLHNFNEDIVVLRAVISNPMTGEEDLVQTLEEQVEIGSYILTMRQFNFSEVLKLLYQQTSSYDRQ